LKNAGGEIFFSAVGGYLDNAQALPQLKVSKIQPLAKKQASGLTQPAKKYERPQMLAGFSKIPGQFPCKIPKEPVS
jgi:hypothetical protein